MNGLNTSGDWKSTAKINAGKCWAKMENRMVRERERCWAKMENEMERERENQERKIEKCVGKRWRMGWGERGVWQRWKMAW